MRVVGMSQIRYCASLFNLEGHSVRSDRISSVNVQLPCTCIVVNLDHRKKEYYNKRAELDRNMDWTYEVHGRDGSWCYFQSWRQYMVDFVVRIFKLHWITHRKEKKKDFINLGQFLRFWPIFPGVVDSNGN